MLSFEAKKPTKHPSQKERSRQASLDDPSNNIWPIAAYASLSSFLAETEQRLQRSREFPVAQRTQQQQQQTGTYGTTYWEGLSTEIPPGPLGYERGIEGFPTNEFGAVGDRQRSGSAAGAVQPAGGGRLSSTPPVRSEPVSPSSLDLDVPPVSSSPRAAETRRGTGRYRSQRRPGNHDEFDGPVQLLERPASGDVETLESDLPQLPTNLNAHEQDEILRDVNEWLSQCAFNFVAKYQFLIPIEPDKKQVGNPMDRDWTEWAYLLKRLATKRRIPARVLYNGQIKQFVAVLENSLEVRHTRDQPRPLKDDRNILQIISAATQVAKVVKDASVMEHFDRLYERVESLILK